MDLMTYTFTVSDLQNMGNDCIVLFVDALVQDKIVTPEVGERLKSDYGLIAYRKGFFGRFLDKLWSVSDKDTSMKIVRFTAAAKPAKQNPPPRSKLKLVQNENTPGKE